MKAVLIAGTHGYKATDAANAKEWWWPTGAFAREVLAPAGIEVVAPAGRAFLWPTGIDGLNENNLQWRAAGINLFAYCVPPLAPSQRIPSSELVVFAHSHAGQVAAYAFAEGLKGTLVTIGTPVRRDMEPVWKLARWNIRRHLHLYSTRDWWQVFGAVWDGAIGVRRTFPTPTRNERMPKGHGNILRDREIYPLWRERGWLDFITGAAAVQT